MQALLLADERMDARAAAAESFHTLPVHAGSHRVRAERLAPLRLPKLERLYCLRHGHTHANDGLLGGVSDGPVNQLDETGRAQAVAGGKALAAMLARDGVQVDAIVASPLGRAMETARIVAATIGFTGEVIAVPALTEHHCGTAENKAPRPLAAADEPRLRQLLGGEIAYLRQETAEHAQLSKMHDGDVLIRVTGGESFDDVIRRQRLALQWLEDQFCGKSVLVVSHGIVSGAMRVLLGAYPAGANDAAWGLSFYATVPRHAEPVQLWPPAR